MRTPVMPDTLRPFARLAVRLGLGLLLLHFLFILLLTEHVTVLPLLLFASAVALVLPPIRNRLAAVPLLGRGLVRIPLVAVLLVLANVWLSSGNRPEIVRTATAFRGATIISGLRGAPAIPNAVVLVNEQGRIVELGPASSLSAPDGYRVVDLAGKFLMPGLINAHAHLMMNGHVPGEPREIPSLMAQPWLADLTLPLMHSYPGRRIVTRLMERNVKLALRAGVTTLRGVGDPGFLDVQLRKRIERGDVLGPRLRVSGPLLCVTGGHAHQIGMVIDGPDEARRAVRTVLQHEVDHIKIASTGGVSDSRRLGEAGELQMTPEEVAAITDEAHRKNILVTAHAESSQGVKEALRAGIDNIEHGAELDSEAIALFNDNPKALRGYTTLHPTLSVIAGPRELTDQIRDNPALYVIFVNGNQIKQAMTTGYRQAVAGGVKIGVGTDAGIVDHASVWKEMLYFVEVGGISNELALHLGTLGTAESIGVDDLTGSIEVGKFADFVIVDGDPRADLETLAKPYLVVAAGVQIDPAQP